MPDIISLLPDHVANQIAAGEVVQRPASVVKELLENSIDAGAAHIKLLFKDAGSSLVQVIDNGKGMSETDARMCWERHATSKISQANDLYNLHTFGFRGEALASIAAVAQVEMKTKRQEDEAATFIRIENSLVQEQTLIAAPNGTSIAVKNLFYNIPARRNFLKSFAVEIKHIIEEFERQAISYPGIHFSLYNNGNEVYDLTPTDLQTRIAQIFTRLKKEQLLSCTDDTEIVQISGFVGAPEIARRTRGEQLFFVNNRYIKSPLFNLAVTQAFEGIIDAQCFPVYVLFLEIPPSKIDVNIHPTKTELKFEDEKYIFTILKACVKKAIGKFVVQPNLELPNLGLDNFLNNPLPFKTEYNPQFEKNNNNTNFYNPFEKNISREKRMESWEKFFGNSSATTEETVPATHAPQQTTTIENLIFDNIKIGNFFQIYNTYIVCEYQQELLIIDQKYAHETILFQRFSEYVNNHRGVTQQLLFPRTIELSATQMQVYIEIEMQLQYLGFDVQQFGGNNIIINGLPAELEKGDEQKVIEAIIEEYSLAGNTIKLSKHDKLALCLAKKTAIHRNTKLSNEQMYGLITQLFSLSEPTRTTDGKNVLIKIGIEFLFDLFRKSKI